MKKDLRSTFSTRQYMLSKDFEIFYYSDKNIQTVSNHSHDYYEFYFFLNGNVSIEIANKSHLLKPGDLIIIPPGVHHHVDILDPDISYQRFVFWISKDYCENLMQESVEYGYMMQLAATSGKNIFHLDILAFNSIQSKAFGLIEELHSNRFGKTAKISLCVNDLVLQLNRCVYELEHLEVSEEKDLCQNIIDFIDEHIDEELSLENIASQFFVSKYHIAHVFKEQFGMSIYQYIIKKRLDLSRIAILGNTQISEAYLMYGFKDYSSFYRAFVKEYGMSPKEYRSKKSTPTLQRGGY